jgi:hypothetical protein
VVVDQDSDEPHRTNVGIRPSRTSMTRTSTFISTMPRLGDVGPRAESRWEEVSPDREERSGRERCRASAASSAWRSLGAVRGSEDERFGVEIEIREEVADDGDGLRGASPHAPWA